jgi:hypothetical protein
MNHFTLRALLLCALLICVAPLFAAKPASDGLARDPVTKLTAQQAVTLGATKFIDLYEKDTQDETTAGMRSATDTYAQLRREINDRAVGKRSKAQRTLIEDARACCTDIASAYLDIDEASSGGGTMYEIENASAMVDVETALGKVILSMEKPASNPAGKQAAMKIPATLLANIKRLPSAYTDDPDTANSWRQQHVQAVKRLKADLPRLQRLLTALPDNGSVALARFASTASKIVH